MNALPFVRPHLYSIRATNISVTNSFLQSIILALCHSVKPWMPAPASNSNAICSSMYSLLNIFSTSSLNSLFLVHTLTKHRTSICPLKHNFCPWMHMKLQYVHVGGGSAVHRSVVSEAAEAVFSVFFYSVKMLKLLLILAKLFDL